MCGLNPTITIVFKPTIVGLRANLAVVAIQSQVVSHQLYLLRYHSQDKLAGVPPTSKLVYAPLTTYLS